MTHELKQRELIIDLATGEFQVWPINDRRIIGPADYGWVRYDQERQRTGRADPDILTWGGGPLAGSRIPGSRRLVFCGYSPSWQGFYVSSFGGGAYVHHRIGADFVCIRGQAPQDSVLILNHEQGQIGARLEPVDPDAIWIGYAPADPDPEDPHGEFVIGFYALQQAVFDRFKAEYEGDWVRVFAVGPSARHTVEGVIGSNQVKKGRILPIDDWAGRGGLGSRLLQRHRIAACIFGGDWEDPDLKDSKEIDGYFMANYGQGMIKVDLGATEKYRYVPGFQTGGTFGVNYHTVGDRLLSFNYASVNQPPEARQAQNDAFIRDHYLRQFNEEIIQPKNFAHCGEPCGVAGKKFDRIYKKDYEPYQALGPQVGVFDQRAAEELNHFVDAMALDAIQAGGTAAWVMECLRDGLFPAEDFGFPPVAEMRFDFASDTGNSGSNPPAEVEKRPQPLTTGPAGPSQFQAGGLQPLNRPEIGRRTVDRAVYTAHRATGCMAPNQYWVPGMFAPMPLMGKYFVYYGLDFLPPRELGKKCVERMVYELYNENTGICRFHRKWSEVIVDEIISAHYNFPVDFKAHQYALAGQIYALEGAAAGPWESERTVDLIWQYLEETGRDSNFRDDDLSGWVERFRADKWAAARAYWEELHTGIAEAFAAGPAAIPDQRAPGPAAKVDVMGKAGSL